MEITENEYCIVSEQVSQDDEEPPSKLASTVSHEVLLPQSFPSRLDKDKPVISDRSGIFMQTYFPGVSEKDWNNWHWQIKNSICKISQLARFLSLSENETGLTAEHDFLLPIRITPYYLSLLNPHDSNDPLRRTMIPVFDEFITAPGEMPDPLSEEPTSPVSNIVHRYPDRVLFLATGFCSAYCRYCTRTHMVAKEKCHMGIKAWEPGLRYVEQHTEIRDVIISGGDPLTMPDLHLEYLLNRLRKISHIEILRIGTKVPVVLPQRITRSLVNLIRKYHPVYMSIHFTHPDEITPEVTEACERLANAGIPLGSQTVLLKGINDEVGIMKQLVHRLLKIRVRPYYLYQCDPIPGSAHFRTSIQKGLDMIQGLRGHTSGYAIPHYVVDAPGGGGKIPLLPDYYQGHAGGYTILRNYQDKLFRYPDHIQ